MGFCFPGSNTERDLRFHPLINKIGELFYKKSRAAVVRRGHVAVYVGDNELKRHVIPISYLNNPLFQDLLSRVEQEYGFNHSMGALTIPVREDEFLHLVSQLSK